MPAVWKSLVIDSNIKFALATKDPDGKRDERDHPHRDHRRRHSAPTTRSSRRRAGGTDPWPTDRYLNVWVCNLGGGLLGLRAVPGRPERRPTAW